MQWTKGYAYIPKYKYTSSNQYGDRFKRTVPKKLSIARIACKTDASSAEMLKLILLSHTLDVPVRYDFTGDQEAYIEVVSGEALKGCI